MNKILKVVLSASLLATMVTSFTACGSKPTETQSQDTSKPKNVEIRFAWWGGDTRHKATLAAIDAYTKLHPNVKIEPEYMGFDGYQKKLITQFAGDAAPDVFQITDAFYPDIASDNFVDLNKYSSLIEINNFNKALLTRATYNNKLQGLPVGVLSTTILYNKDFFKKFNIPEDTKWTWENLLDYGKKVRAQDKNAYLTTGDLDTINRLFVLPYLSQKSGDIWIKDDYTVSFDKPLLTQSLKYLSDLFTTGTMQPLGETTAFIAKMEQNPAWINGNIGLIIGLTSGINLMQTASPNSHFDVTSMPIDANAKNSANAVRASGLFSVNSKSKAVEESIKFINWMLNDKDAAVILGEERGTPASSTAIKALSDANKINPLVAKAMDISNKNPGKVPNAITENPEISKINKDVITEIGYGKITPEQGADEILKGYEAKIKELKAAAGK